MARLARTSLVAFALLAACLPFAAPAAAAPPCKHAGDRAGEASDLELAQASVCLMNKARAERGLRALKVNRRLARAARGALRGHG